ncbi:FecR domain-containing protein [Planctomicrobium sp. SH661]|uniref:FecR domain-containing protein n=1 Tax=Planctomicrobium sp. SH661 TaxID=3448124 RepID=UPI003F5BF298
MDVFPTPADEVRSLADAMYDGRIDRHRMDRLESLIVNDLGCLQVYVERMTFHGELLRNSEVRTPEQAAMAVLKEFSQAIRLRERRAWLTQLWVYSAMVASLMLVVGSTLYLTNAFQPASMGVVSSLSAGLRVQNSSMDLGQVVRRGEAIRVDAGIVSLQLSNVLVDVLGPACVRLEKSGKMFLDQGTVLAKILPGGEGFTVTTPDVQVVDLGTEFLVKYEVGSGTDVSVRQGRAQASLLDWRGKPTKVIELTDNRSAQFQGSTQSAREVEYQLQAFAPIDRSRAGIRSIDGTLRTATRSYVALFSGQVQTPNHMLVIPELQEVRLSEDLEVMGIEGRKRIPAGTTISSYLIHYDPTTMVTTAPRGGVTFFGEVAAVIASSDGLQATDPLLGLPGVRFESARFRGLELDEDEVHVSKDRRTVSFYCGVNPGEHLDEARVLVISGPAPGAPAE